MASLLTACSTAPDMEQQIDELYGKMSQEERIAQLRSMYMDDLFDDQGNLDTIFAPALSVGGVKLVQNTDYTVSYRFFDDPEAAAAIEAEKAAVSAKNRRYRENLKEQAKTDPIAAQKVRSFIKKRGTRAGIESKVGFKIEYQPRNR